MLHWIQTHETILWWLAAASVVTFVATLIVAAWLVARIPSDYFVPGRRPRGSWADRHPIVRGIGLIGKNVLGCVFLLAGTAMLVLPGQGILTILVGIMLLSFPGKARLERWLVERRPVRQSINWLRRRANRAPLDLGP